ncbi:MAG: heavy metal translocating P-type ATPase, partial [Chroococcidiopsidaceae cyanobacterium CP_BM_ER_R8_30]|nr:heavy metal translocating P-type ATPase [Chroococcidiopsidaceae cyanobacterium CP_BM_ER_R8_30]
MVTTVTKNRSSSQITTHVEDIHYQVVHWVPGRIRIRLPTLAHDPEYATKLQYSIASLNFITNVRISAVAMSVIVEYAHEANMEVSARLQSQVFHAIQEAALADIPRSPTSKEEAHSHEINYWERLGLPSLGLLLGLATLVGVPIPGVVIAAVILAGAVPVFQRALDAIQQQRQLNIDFLDGLAISLQTLQGNYFPPAFMLALIESGEIV